MITNTEWRRLKDLVEGIGKNSGWIEGQSRDAEEDRIAASSVREFLERKGHVPRHGVQVAFEDGQVILTGEVSWLQRMPEAEEGILRMPDVSRVTNRLTVRPYESANDLKSRIVEALESRAHLIASRIRIERKDGIVTLRGTASSAQYRDLAGQVAACAPGVSRVENLIEVQPSS